MQHNTNTAMIVLPAKELAVHKTAQRDLVPSKLKQLVSEMNLDAIGVLHAVKVGANGHSGYYVIDGQHRLTALMQMDLGDWPVEVKVHLDADTPEKASRLFLDLNNRAAVSTFGKYTNEVHAGVRESVGITAVAASRGLKFSQCSSAQSINCVAASKQSWLLDEGKSFACALDVIHAAWGFSPSSLEGRIVHALSLVFSRRDSIDKAALSKKLAKFPGGPAQLIGTARALTNTSKMSVVKAIAQVIITTYNSGRRAGAIEPL